jgi:hypothetical protein
MGLKLRIPEFKSVVKYTEPGHYHVDVCWDDFLHWLNRQLHRDFCPLKVCPDFQRGHVWSKQQQIDYVEFKLAKGSGADVLHFNCPGWMNNFKGPFELVDGLQRITAVKAFLNGKIKAFGYYLSEYKDPQYIRSIDFSISINNLKTREEVLRWYIQLNSGGTPHSEEELKRVADLLKNEIEKR